MNIFVKIKSSNKVDYLYIQDLYHLSKFYSVKNINTFQQYGNETHLWKNGLDEEGMRWDRTKNYSGIVQFL